MKKEIQELMRSISDTGQAFGQGIIKQPPQEPAAATIPCPFVYSTGRPCKGHIDRIEAFKADLCWSLKDNGMWSFSADQPRSHYHLYCSEKGNHSGAMGQDRLKYFYNQLPPALQAVIDDTSPRR